MSLHTGAEALLGGVANGPVLLGAFLCWSVLGIHYLLERHHS